jgi:hypothetical protein
MSRRRGISLLELTAVLAGCSVILSTSGSLIYRAMRAHSQSARYFDSERAAWRLANQFRLDIRQATDVTHIAADEGRGPRIQLDSEANVIAYELVEDRVVRAVSREDRVVATEEYRLAPGLKCDFSQTSSPRLVTLTITVDESQRQPTIKSSPATIRSAPVILHTEAVLGADRRFAASPEEAP